jgi:hypothetical protein
MPLALGYLHRECSLRHFDIGEAQQRLAEAARLQGCTLGTVHSDDVLTDPGGFGVLLETARSLGVGAVIVPTLAVLGSRDDPRSKLNRLRELGIRVLAADRPVADLPEVSTRVQVPVLQGGGRKRRGLG